MRRAAIYCRISKDEEGLALGVTRQRKECVDKAVELGWTVAEVFTDNYLRADEYRPEYERLMAALEARQYNALIAWDVDRITRHPIQLERIIDLAESRDIALATVSGYIDLATPQGRLTARIKATVARHEIEQMSRRIKSKLQQRAEAGQAHGAVPYGWRRKNGRDELYEPEAAVVREIAERLLSGESVGAVTKSLLARGIEPPYNVEVKRQQAERRAQRHPDKAKPFDPKKVKWNHTTVRNVVCRPRNAGLRLHQGKVIGKGDWEPIFGENTHARLLALFATKEQTRSNANSFRYLLSGIAKCGKCGFPVRALVPSSHQGACYACNHCFGVKRLQAPIDRLIVKLVTRRLAKPDARAIFVPVPDPHLADEAEAIRAKLDLAAMDFADDVIDGDQLRIITEKLRPRLQELDVQLRPVLMDFSDLATPDIAERWDSIPLERRRAVIEVASG
jgi:site-specific DNA recombinase